MISDIDDKRRKRILGLLFLGVLMGALDIAIVGPALPALGEAFSVDRRALSWVFSVYILCNLVGTPVMAKLSDRQGRRAIYLLCVILFATGSLVVAFAPNFSTLLVGRGIQGLGSGGIFPVASAVIGDLFPPEKRGSALGLIGAVFGIAFLIGPIVGGLVLLTLSWHWLFLINMPIALFLVVAGGRLLPGKRQTEPRPFDLLGTVLLGALLVAVSLTLNHLDTSDILGSLLGPSLRLLVVLTLVLFPLVVWVETLAKDPVLRPGLFGVRQIALAMVFALGAGLAEATGVFLPDFAVEAFGVSQSKASFMLLPLVLAVGFGAPLGGRLNDRRGSRFTTRISFALLGSGMLLFAFRGQDLGAFYAAGALIGLGLSGMVGSTLRYIVLNATPPKERASAQGAVTLFQGMGKLLSAAMVGAVAGSAGSAAGGSGYQQGFLVLGVLCFLLLLLTPALADRASELDDAQR